MIKLIALILVTLPLWGVTCPAGYGYWGSLTIDHTQVGSSDSSNFPVLFTGDTSLKTVGNGGKVQSSSGYDIIVGSVSGSAYNFERVIWSASSGSGGEWWAEIPTLSHSSNTTFYVFYGNASVTTDQQSSPWDSNYAMVQHLPNGSSLTANDSTANANNGTNANATATTGEIDGGAAFNGSNADIDFGLASSLQITGNITAELWFNATSWPPTGNDYVMFDEGYSFGSNTRGWELRLYNFSSTNYIYWDTNTGSIHGCSASTTTSTGTWHHLVGTWNGTAWTAYLDGVQFCTSTDSQAPQNNSVHVVAGALGSSIGNPFFNFPGSLDELRVSNTNRSVDWITAEYNNQSSPSGFLASSSWGNACGAVLTSAPLRSLMGVGQ